MRKRMQNVDPSGRMLTMTYSQHVGAEDMRRCLGSVRELIADLQSGFLLLADLSGLDSMDPSCAPDIGAIMDLFNAKELETVVRVIPDPGKDIGFAIISRFHYDKRVQTLTYDSLVDAVQSSSVRTAKGDPSVGLSA